jgi:hypothetical protein
MSVGNKPKILQDSEQIQEFDCVWILRVRTPLTIRKGIIEALVEHLLVFTSWSVYPDTRYLRSFTLEGSSVLSLSLLAKSQIPRLLHTGSYKKKCASL